MKNLEIQVNSKNNQILKSSDILGISSENLQGKIIFKPVPFVDGACRLYIENKGTILMEKEEDCYTLDILSSLLTEPSLDICFKITEPQNEKGTPVFCSKIIHLKVLDTIDSDEEIPEQYPSWEQILDSKIAELEALEEDVEESEEERNQAVQEAIGNIQDMTEAYNQNAVAKTKAFNTNATNKTNAFDNHVSNKEAEFDTDTDAIVSTKKAELDEYEESKENELDTYTNGLKNDLNSYESAKETELNSYTGEKKTELDTYEGTKETELDTYVNGLKSDFDTNATNKTTAFDTNATNKTNEFNTNATNKTTEFDNNATTKTTTFNENATEKTVDFNDNVDEKTAEFDTHVTEKEVEFDENVDNIQEQITDIQEFIDSEMDKETTEKSTRIDITNAAKWYSQLPPTGRTTQKQLSGKNIYNEEAYKDKSLYSKTANYYAYVELSNTFKTKFYANMFLKGVSQNLVAGFTTTKNGTFSGGKRVLNNGTLNTNVECDFTDAEHVYFAIGNSNYVDLEADVDAIFNNYNIQCTLQSEETPTFEQYCGGQASPNPDYPQPIENVEGRIDFNICNKNLGNIEDLYNDMVAFNPNNVRKEVVDNKQCIVFSNYHFQQARGFRGLLNRYKKNTRYKIDCDVRVYDTTITTSKGLFVQVYDINDNRIGSASQTADGSTWHHLSFITNDSADFSYLAFSYGAITDWCLANFSITEYVAGEEYEYIESTEQIIPFPLQDGQKLMEGDYLAEDGVHHVRGQVIYDGTENFQKRTNLEHTFQITLRKTSSSGKCSHYQSINSSSFDVDNGIYLTYTNVLIISDLRFSTVADFKSWLATQYANGTPVTIEYIIRGEETIDPYTPAQAEAYNKLMNLMLYKGVNHIWTNTDGLEPSLQLTYYKSNKLRLDSIEATNKLRLDNIEARLELLEN